MNDAMRMMLEILLMNQFFFIPSPFLWYDMIAGDLLPLLGVILFFVVNYPRVKEF